MTKPPNCFKIGALNCQGLRDKIDFPEVQDLIRSCDIFGVCETWLGDEDDIYIDDFKFYPFNRKNPTGAPRGGLVYLLETNGRST